MSAIYVSLLLASIAAVESNNNPHAVGHAGERSAYQMTAETWARHAKPDEPFALASSDPVLAEHIADLHVQWLCKQLESHGIPVTPYSLCAAWHRETKTFQRHALTPAEADHVQRCVNLYEDAIAKLPGNVPVHLR
jgi:hypothetical protein